MGPATKVSKILVVDDEPKIRLIYKKLLMLQNYEVLEAEDFKAASRLLIQNEDVDLVLLDINMPVMDGGMLYRMIRLLDARIKVLVTSAYSVQDQMSKISRADDYYDKSQGTDLLLDKVSRLLNDGEEKGGTQHA